jgi:putative oxidoreductase
MFTGFGLITHGMTKIPPSEKFLETVAKLGFPLPTMFGWAAGLSEFAGGALLIVGLLTRPASFFILITMLVAIFGRHAADPFGVKELAALYAFIAFAFMIAGAGDWSVDAMLRPKGRRRR